MGFRLVPKSVTLNDLERRHVRFCVISPNVNAMSAISAVAECLVHSYDAIKIIRIS